MHLIGFDLEFLVDFFFDCDLIERLAFYRAFITHKKCAEAVRVNRALVK